MAFFRKVANLARLKSDCSFLVRGSPYLPTCSTFSIWSRPTKFAQALQEVGPVRMVADGMATEDIVRVVAADLEQVEPFYIVDLGRLVHLRKQWKSFLPRVQPFYAVKCNPIPNVLSVLNGIDLGFDCASEKELRAVLNIGVPPERIIYANPIKQRSHLRFAAEAGVHLSTFDSEDEVVKIVNCDPRAQLVLRLRADDMDASLVLGNKFGVDLSECFRLLQFAHQKEANVIGVCFHIGWNCSNPSAYGQAIEMAHQVFQYGSSIGYNFTLLDIGGGFPGHHGSEELFEAISAVVNTSLLKFFDDERIRVVAEPGTYFAMSPFTLATCVIGRRKVVEDSEHPKWMYFLNDGMFGSFRLYHNSLIELSPPNPLDISAKSEVTRATIWGPTCDSTDEIISDISLPLLNVGDWLYFKNFGAYTSAASSGFNGFSNPEYFYYMSYKDAE